MRRAVSLTTLVALAWSQAGCSESIVSSAAAATNPAAPSGTTRSATVAGSATDIYTHFSSALEVYREGDSVVLRTTDIPPHVSPYFGIGHPQYVEPHAGMVVNPNRILPQDFEFRVPAEPQAADRGSETPLGAIGVAVNGVVLFNQYAGPGFQPLDNEIPTFDALNGHPQQTGVYHYHFEPLDVTRNAPGALVGVLLDGFPLYGPYEADGGAPAQLDECNGHIGVTPDNPDGIYHYHVTEAFPYLSGCFRGRPGRVTN